MSYSCIARDKFALLPAGMRKASIANARVWERITERGSREGAGMRSMKLLPFLGVCRGIPVASFGALLSNRSFDADTELAPL
jgi:hypothetical protein